MEIGWRRGWDIKDEGRRKIRLGNGRLKGVR